MSSTPSQQSVFNRRSLIRRLRLDSIATAMTCAAVCWARAAAADSTSQSFTVGPSPHLIVQADRGAVDIVAGAEGLIRIDVTRTLRSNRDPATRAALEQHQLIFSQTDNRVRVEARGPEAMWRWGWKLDVRFRITLPKSARVDVRTTGGRIHVTGINGKVQAWTVGGALRFRNLGGSVFGRTSGQAIQVDRCAESVDVQTAGGNIDLAHVGGVLDARAFDGHIRATWQRPPAGGATLRTHNGDIHLSLPQTSRCELDLAATSGRVETDFPRPETADSHGKQSWRGKINGGGPPIRARAVDGHIQVSAE